MIGVFSKVYLEVRFFHSFKRAIDIIRSIRSNRLRMRRNYYNESCVEVVQ